MESSAGKLDVSTITKGKVLFFKLELENYFCLVFQGSTAFAATGEILNHSVCRAQKS